MNGNGSREKITAIEITLNSEQTEPEFASKISKSNFVVSPVAIEIHSTVLTSLKHLKYTL